MSASDLALSVRDVSKAYTILHNQPRITTAAEALLRKLRRPFARPSAETFWALQDLSFDVQVGEVVGIVGRNGAGKSTLLKILSRITEPTKGQIELYGRVGSLLEVGTGFHQELTGRENIHLNGTILGMKRREIDRQFDAIVDFAGVERFLDTPVKRYSSGMYVRLAFAVAAHLSTEILVVDEVLAVGDAEFQRKCLGKIRDVSTSGRTVLFVSHNMAAVRQFCTTGVLLNGGRVVRHGAIEDVVTEYLTVKTKQEFAGRVSRHGLEVTDVALRDVENDYETLSPSLGGDYVLTVGVRAHKPLAGGAMVVRIHDDVGTLVSTICTPEEGMGAFDYDGQAEVTFNLPSLQLLPGRYSVSVYMYRQMDAVCYMEVEDALSFEMQPAMMNGSGCAYDRHHGLVRVAD
ncbi:MAG: ABC transporter ATP-binding protein, partial [Tepidisphaeraceae bacterium]